MDSGVDEELNYEEDEPENDELCKDLQNGECTEDSATNNSNLESDDQYLQIDYLDDENLADDTVPLESTTTTSVVENDDNNNNNDGKAVEKNENSNQENVSTVVQKELNPVRKSGDSVVGNLTKRKKRLRPFQRRVEFKKKLTNSFCLNPWLPEYNFLHRQHQATQFVNRTPILKAKQEFYPIRSSPLPQLMANNNGYLQSPSTRLGIGVSSQSFPQQSNNLLGQPFNSDGSGYEIENGQTLLSRSFGYKGIKSRVFQNGCNISNSSGLEQIRNLNRINQPHGNTYPTKNVHKTVPYSGNVSNGGGAAFTEEPKSFPATTGDRFINNVQYKPFQEEEKKAIMMKKEARLKRFMQDDLVKKDKLADSGFEESSQYGSPPKVRLFEKKEKKFVIEEQEKHFVSSNDTEREGPLEKLHINKELLLRKKNPFGGSLGMLSSSLTAKANQNGNIDAVKVERDDTRTSTCLGERSTKTEAIPPAPSQSLVPIKTETETESHVKFIRTVSKSFDELTFKKPKAEVPEPQGKLLPKQLEPQLTGCIVKVLNIPPSTTTNDILALCSPVGIVMEVKLNCPKENSVVIRFAEPKLAEKFFSLYHGQKMNNYFLNVIVV